MAKSEKIENKRVVEIELAEELRHSYMDYAMSVIVARALPDVRDGLKPVQRRIIYAMHREGMHPNKSHSKSAAVVGEVMKNYHPHGDAPIYEAMVRMAQPWALRYPLVDGHGNFGSIDGDSQAASRYTEARMAPLSAELITDIGKGTVDFVDNYSSDPDHQEPAWLPTVIPNLLINGVSGIAVGMATSMPPHNIREVGNALLAILKKPELDGEGLLKFIQGPDFPTGGTIFAAELAAIYATGHGKLTVRSKVELETSAKGRDQIVVKEIPYQVNKVRMMETIVELVNSKRIEGIADIRDESGRKEAVRLVIELKKGADWEGVLRELYLLSQMQSTFSIMLLAIEEKRPKIFSLKGLLDSHIQHRRNVIVRRAQYELIQAELRKEILDGLLIALRKIDEVIATIRRAPDEIAAQSRLEKTFKLTERQAKAIVDMRLGRVSRLEVGKVKTEKEEVEKQIKDFTAILRDAKRRDAIIVSEIEEFIQKYGDDRRTEVKRTEALEVTASEVGVSNEMGVVVTEGMTIHAVHVDKMAQVSSKRIFEKKLVTQSAIAPGRGEVLLFTKKGEVARVRIPELNEAGGPIERVLDLPKGSEISALVPIVTEVDESFVVVVSRNGQVQRSPLAAYLGRLRSFQAMKLAGKDEVGWAFLTNGKKELLLFSNLGRAVNFSEEEVRPSGRDTQGVGGIKLPRGGTLVYAAVSEESSEILLVTKKGFAKRSPIAEFPVAGRNIQGVVATDLKALATTGEIVGGAVTVGEKGQVFLGVGEEVKEVAVASVKKQGRGTKGGKLEGISEVNFVL